MNEDFVLSEDLEYLEELLSQFGAYSFSEDLKQRMDKLNISSSALGKRCFVSHTMIDKWKTGKAKPNGKERFKELGMALEMSAEELDSFLLCNGYPKLYIKNPLDGAARLLLLNSQGNPSLIEMYRELINRLGLDKLSGVYDDPPLSTAVMSIELKQAVEDGSVSGWFKRFRGQFTGGEKTQLPDLHLCRFILLYLGESNVYELFSTGELPVNLKNMLYKILSGKGVTVRYLREKIIAFGLYFNMTEDEIDIMLDCMKLQTLTEPLSLLDNAILGALRCAHEKYPYYELDNLVRIMEELSPPQDEYEAGLLDHYRQRKEIVDQMVLYYEKHPLSKEEEAFEKMYTSYSDHGVMDYVRDLIEGLTMRGCLSDSETSNMLNIMKRNDLDNQS